MTEEDIMTEGEILGLEVNDKLEYIGFPYGQDYDRLKIGFTIKDIINTNTREENTHIPFNMVSKIGVHGKDHWLEGESYDYHGIDFLGKPYVNQYLDNPIVNKRYIVLESDRENWPLKIIDISLKTYNYIFLRDSKLL